MSTLLNKVECIGEVCFIVGGCGDETLHSGRVPVPKIGHSNCFMHNRVKYVVHVCSMDR